MHLVPYIFLFLVGMLGLLLLTADPEGGFHWVGYTGASRSPVEVGVVRVVGAVLVVLAVLPIIKNKIFSIQQSSEIPLSQCPQTGWI